MGEAGITIDLKIGIVMDWNYWLTELISCFRSEAEKLQPEQKSRISNLDDLSFPCQVDVIWLQNSRFGFDFQIIIFQHFQDRGDLEINVHGPIAFHNAIDTLEQILADETWSRELTDGERYFIEDEERTIRTILEGQFLTALEELNKYVSRSSFTESPIIPAIYWKSYLTEDCFAWIAEGNIHAIEPKEIVAKVINYAITDTSQVQAQIEAQPQSKAEQQAYGTYFYPAIWVGEMPKRSFSQKARKQLFPRLAERNFHLEYKGFQTVVQEDGLVVIVTDSKESALEMLNEIMGTALVSGLPCFAVRESEIADIKIEPVTSAIRGSTMSLVSDRMRLGQERMSIYPSSIPKPRNIISEEDLVNLLRRAELITHNAEIGKSLSFLLESFTHLCSSEYPQCFVMGWTVVERFITTLWEDYLSQKGVTGDRRRKMSQGMMWTVDDILETLNLVQSISDEWYGKLMNLKGKRNKILHRGETATEEDAKECLEIASIIIEDSVRNLGKPFIIRPQIKVMGLR